MSWYAPHLELSLRAIIAVAPLGARIIDVGGGASTLVDDLVAAGYRAITVLDVSESALDASRTRLGARGAAVRWLAADVTAVHLLPAAFDLWHDRAVFHFLTEKADRAAYVRALRRSLAPDGHAIISTFALTGPAKCSGLNVVRYDAAGLAAQIGKDFELTASTAATHVTPAGKPQDMIICTFRRRPGTTMEVR